MRKFSKNDNANRKLPPEQYHATQQNGSEVPEPENIWTTICECRMRTSHALSSSAEVLAACTPRPGSHGRGSPSRSLTSTTIISSGPCSTRSRPVACPLDEAAAPIRSILRRQKNVTVLMTEVVGVEPHARVVFTRAGRAAYDYLVPATGIEYNYLVMLYWAISFVTKRRRVRILPLAQREMAHADLKSASTNMIFPSQRIEEGVLSGVCKDSTQR
jgi:hypothetical protein